MDEQQITALVVDEVTKSVTDLRVRIERLEQLHADRMDPAVTAAAAVVDAELVALARTANLSSDEPTG